MSMLRLGNTKGDGWSSVLNCLQLLSVDCGQWRQPEDVNLFPKAIIQEK